MNHNQRIQYIHLFRGVAILFIVASHLIWATGDFPEVKKALRLLVSNSTVLFMIISGFLFEHLAYKYKPIPFIKKKIKNILLPYIVCSIPIIVFLLIRQSEDNRLLQTILYIINGNHLGPYWYIPVIMTIFLISPFIIYIRKFKVFQIALIFTLLFSLASIRPNSYNILHNIVYYFGFFHLGMVLCMHRVKFEKWLRKRSLYLFIFSIWITVYLLLIKEALPSIFLTIQLLLLGYILITICYHIKNQHLINLLSLFGDYSFGIYFLHQYVINIFASIVTKFGVNYQSLGYSIIIYPIVIITCLIIIFTIKVLVGNSRSRIVVGS